MNPTFLTLYLMLWPTIAVGVLITLCVGLYRDYKVALDSGESLV